MTAEEEAADLGWKAGGIEEYGATTGTGKPLWTGDAVGRGAESGVGGKLHGYEVVAGDG